jgi:hypothetical protein
MPIEGPAITSPGIERFPEASFYVPATETTTRLRRTMKHDDCFLVSDSHGDIGASLGGPDGLFNCDTRYLSHFELLINGLQPLLLGSNLSHDNCVLSVDLTNPDIYFDKRTAERPTACGADGLRLAFHAISPLCCAELQRRSDPASPLDHFRQ